MFQYQARLVRAIDADTVVLDLDLGFHTWLMGTRSLTVKGDQGFRLLRINAPERNTAEGQASKAALEAFLAGKRLVVQTFAADLSFARWLIELTADDANVSDWLVANGWAVYQTYR